MAFLTKEKPFLRKPFCDLSLATMLVLEQVSVIMILREQKNKLLSGRRGNNKKDKKSIVKGFPGGAMQGTWFEPWSGKIPHAAEQLSPCTTTIEPVL